MKIRLMGTKEELDIYTGALEQNYSEAIYEISDYYKNRGNSKLMRCYIELKDFEYEGSIEKKGKEIVTLPHQERH